MIDNARISHAEIRPSADAALFPGGDEPKAVYVTVNGVEVEAFGFYSDELSFTPAEFVGLTLEEARGLHLKRDMEWLRS